MCKRFLFDFIFFYAHLFYVAFEKIDIVGLQKELIVLALSDQFRRIATEIILPKFFQKTSDRIKKDESKMSLEEREFAEIQKQEYSYFEDYMELVIQYGYLTLFAAAFPISSCITAVFVWLEARSDIYKIQNLCRRPVSYNINDIGVWA